jgi:hypothetical protein
MAPFPRGPKQVEVVPFSRPYPHTRQSRCGVLYLARKDHTVTESEPPFTGTSVRRSRVELLARFRRCRKTAARIL